VSAAGTGNAAVREAWLEAKLRAIPPGSRILDAGAGEGQHRRFCAHLDYVAQDFARYDGQGDGRGLQTGSWDRSRLDIVSDITAIPLPDGSFDAVLCVEVFEHLPDPVGAIREFARLLRAGGDLLITAPFCSLTHFAPYHFTSGFSAYFYERHLPAHGFAVREIAPNGNFFEYVAQEVRRIPEVARRFAGGGPTLTGKLAARALLGMLGRLSRRDRGSSELLCFGHHVHAVRS
jgi:ubiquinone/menaquinone biosynthesis C-methylase UbiE